MTQTAIKFPNSSKSISLSQFETKDLFCPVTENIQKVYAIPLHLIEEDVHNPGRINGTDQSNSNQIFDDLITNPKGQIHPICVKYVKATGKFRLVYGYNRLWAFRKAKQQGYDIEGTSNCDIYARIHNGTTVSEITEQIKENGNKPPAKPATKDDMVFQLKRLIDAGGLDDIENNVSFFSLSDEEQKNVAQRWMRVNVPLWGGRKFSGLWNDYCASGQATVNNFKNWNKVDMSAYFLNNNDEGITKSLVKLTKGRDYIKSGDIFTLTRHDKKEKVAVYLTTQPNCYNAGALLVNVSRKRFIEKPDRIIVIQTINGATSNQIIEKRQGRVDDLVLWHENMKHVIDKIYWLPQSRDEIKKHYNSGGWARIDDF